MASPESESLARLLQLAEINPRGSITIEREPHPNALPWSCNIGIGEHGYGTGNTMIEAVEDALRDLDEHC